MLRQLVSDTRGGVITTELVLLASAVGSGVLAGSTVLRDAIHQEFIGLAYSIQTKQPVRVVLPPEPSGSESINGVELFMLDDRSHAGD